MRYPATVAEWYVKSFQLGFVLGWLRLGRRTKVAFIVLACDGDSNANRSEDELQQELERTIMETRRIDGKWSVEKVTVVEDP
jgi:hypothetical protein